MNLNRRAAELCEELERRADVLRIGVSTLDNGARRFDCGVESLGGIEAGLMLARVCMAGLGEVKIVPGQAEIWSGPAVMVTTDHPVAACMASQYAGWEVKLDDYFAMGSGPMRARAGREELFDRIEHREASDVAIGVLESGKLPTAAVADMLASKCSVDPASLTLLAAPTRSMAGTIQVVARSVETAMHKLDELGFDLSRVRSGYGTAPLPPPAATDLAGVGRTNDAILYGGEVTLYVTDDDMSLRDIGPKIPSSASADHGRPFAAIFERYDHDFFNIDPALFSPAVVTLVNLDTGNSFRFGHTLPRVIHESFGMS